MIYDNGIWAFGHLAISESMAMINTAAHYTWDSEYWDYSGRQHAER